VQDFGLDVDAFESLVGDCPTPFLNLAVLCCNVRCRLTYRLADFIIMTCINDSVYILTVNAQID
jgi:hypothetical protein